MSGQFEFGGGDAIQKSGQEASQLSCCSDGEVLVLVMVEVEGLIDVDLLELDTKHRIRIYY